MTGLVGGSRLSWPHTEEEFKWWYWRQTHHFQIIMKLLMLHIRITPLMYLIGDMSISDLFEDATQFLKDNGAVTVDVIISRDVCEYFRLNLVKHGYRYIVNLSFSGKHFNTLASIIMTTVTLYNFLSGSTHDIGFRIRRPFRGTFFGKDALGTNFGINADTIRQKIIAAITRRG